MPLADYGATIPNTLIWGLALLHRKKVSHNSLVGTADAECSIDMKPSNNVVLLESNKPFLKWAGGKFKIIQRILAELPEGKRLIEPFLGSGAVFLNAQYDEFLLADSNADLINLFLQVQQHGAEFADYAAVLFTPENNTEEAFYEFREEFNTIQDVAKKSALFVYLNRHCFNGLYRCNSKGRFNVPFGRYAKPAFPHKELLNFHHKSQGAIFVHQDFLTTMNQAVAGDVVYCDPPYAPLTPTANFSSYTSAGFNQKEQESLANKACELQERGVKVVISNHDTPFTRSIYQSARIVSFDVQRFISSKAKERNKAAELMACYE